MNLKRFAIEFAYKFKTKNDSSILNLFSFIEDKKIIKSINNCFNSLVNFGSNIYEVNGLDNSKSKLIYCWIMTIGEFSLNENDIKIIFIKAIDGLIKIDEDKIFLKNFLEDILYELDEKVEIKTNNSNVMVKYQYEEEVEFLDDIIKYLPIEFFNDENTDFINHLKYSFVKNITNKCFQFSYISFYMLFVTYLYKTTWLLNFIGHENATRYITNMISNTSEKEFNEFNNLFNLSVIKEGNFCDVMPKWFTKLIKGERSNILGFVDKRNQCSHPVGTIVYSEVILIETIKDILKYTSKIERETEEYLLKYVKDNLDKISFNKELILSENEVLFLLSKKDEILNFNSDTDENIRKKMNFLNLIYNNYTENINFEEGKIFELFLELFKGYDKNIALYYYLEELHFFIKSFKSEDKKLIEKIKEIGLEKDDEVDCIGFIENI